MSRADRPPVDEALRDTHPMQKFLLLTALVLLVCALSACGGGSSTTATVEHRRFPWEGPADLHPRWEAAEILVEEAEELRQKFEGLRPSNLHGRLAVLAQLEQLDRSCTLGYGISGCRRKPMLFKTTKRLYEAIVPASRRHVGLNMGTQVATIRYRPARRRHEGFRANQLGFRAYSMALRIHAQCKGIPTCPYERAGHVAAQLKRELFGSRVR